MGWLIGQDDPDVFWAGPEWISIKDAADMCNTTPETIRALVRSRKISATVEQGTLEIYARGLYEVLDSLR